MNEPLDWQAANAPMLAALEQFHAAHKVTGEISHESVLAFYATLQNAYLLIPNAAEEAEIEGGGPLSFALELEPYEDGMLLSIFSSVAQARAFFGAEHKLNRIIQAAPDFFGAMETIVQSLEENGQKLRGVVLDRAGVAGYFFEPEELEILASARNNLGSIRIE